MQQVERSMGENKDTKEKKDHLSHVGEVAKVGYSTGGPFFLLATQASIAVVLVTSALYCGYYYGESIPVPKEPLDMTTNLAYTLRCLFPLALVQFFFIARVGNIRFSSRAANPLSGNEHLVQLQKNISNNTLEQLVMFAMGILSLSTLLATQQELRFVPILCSLFVVGRVLFAIGYSIQPRYRSTGMSMNIYLLVFIIAAHLKLLYYDRGLLWELDP